MFNFLSPSLLMSNTDFQENSFQEDLRIDSTDFPAYDQQWSYINDSNNGVYSNGWVTFSNASLIGMTSDKFYDLKNSYLQIPYYAVATLTGTGACSFGSSNAAGTNTYAHVAENCFVVSPKSDHQHIIDLVSAKLNGVNLNRQSQYTNLMMTENLKKQTVDHERIYHEGCSIDSADGYKINAAVLETNNDTIPMPTIVTSTANDPTTFTGVHMQQSLHGGFGSRMLYNDAIVKRLMKNNFDCTPIANNNSLFGTHGAGILQSSSFSNSLQNGFMGAYRVDGTKVDSANTATGSAINRLLWQYVANIPLSQICDVYSKIPSVSSLANFELRLQLNVASNNSWSVTYAVTSGVTNVDMKPLVIASVASNQSVGTCCPFLISPASVRNSITGINPYPAGCVVSSAVSTNTITVTSGIGYIGSPDSLTITPGSVQQGCRLWIPQIGFTPEYSAKILDSPKKTITYKDFYVDTIPTVANASGGSQVSKLFVANLAHVRQIYVIPYFAVGASTTATQVSRSLVSSAPTTCSFCRLSNFQVQIGGVNVLNENIQLSNQFYENSMLQALALVNGNAHESELISGLVTKSMFQRCYNVYTLDLKRVADEVQDDVLKSFMLNFKIDTKGAYEFVVLVTYDNSVTIDRIGGSVTSADDM